MQSVPSRQDVPLAEQWRLDSIYQDDQAWKKALDDTLAALPSLSKHKGHLGDSPEALLNWFADVEPVLEVTMRIYVYASCRYATDTTNQQAAGMTSQAGALYAQVLATIAFAEPELLSLDRSMLKSWLAETKDLALYRHFMDEIWAKAPHVLSAEVEEILGQVSDALDTGTRTHSILADADLTFAPAKGSDGAEREVTQASREALLVSPDRALRRTAWESYADGHLAVKNAMANCMSAGVKQHVVKARARHYDSSLQAALAPHHIPTSVYTNVIDSFRANLRTWHRYWRVRKRALGLEQLAEYDITAPLAKSPVVPFDQAVDWICEGLAPMGQDYVDTLRRGIYKERWVDRAVNQGKASGAFSTGCYGTQPFILLSWADDVFSLSTLAHELGHSMHSYNTWSHQPFVYGDYSIFVAEVASNFHQAMVRHHLLKTLDDRDMQIALIEEAMANYHRYFFLMPTLARFELAIHEQVERGEPLTADGMTDMLADMFDEGYGGEVAMDRERIGITWAEFHTHLYANFYVYQYTTGIAGAQTLAGRVLSGKESALDAYLGYLRAGSSGYPLDVLRAAGVDLTTPKPIEQAFDGMSEMIDRLANLLGVEPS